MKKGRPRLNLNEQILRTEIEKYRNREQSATKTFQNLKIGKTSFYRILKQYK